MIGNNHHETPFPGEDIQIFERDLPGENTAGLSGQDISPLPLETCNTMNGMWGYKIADQNYKTTDEIIRQLVKAAGMGANLLLNVGPQPNGEAPEAAMTRLAEIGEWLRPTAKPSMAHRPVISRHATGELPPARVIRLFVHVWMARSGDIDLPLTCKVRKATAYGDKSPLRYTKRKDGA